METNRLRKGLKTKTALSSCKALTVLDELLNTAEKDQDNIRAADAVLKAGKVHLGKDKAHPRIVIHIQTIDKQLVLG